MDGEKWAVFLWIVSAWFVRTGERKTYVDLERNRKMKIKSKLMAGGIADLINAIKMEKICVEINVLCIVEDRGRKRLDNSIASWEMK